jgi:hypothetical protein
MEQGTGDAHGQYGAHAIRRTHASRRPPHPVSLNTLRYCALRMLDMDLPDDLPPLIDFERAHLAWITKAGSHARFRVIASAVGRPPGQDWQERVVLAPLVMAGDVYGAGRLPLDPPYSFQIFASPERHVIVRDFPAGPPKGDSVAANGETFSSLVLHAPALAPRPIAPADLVPDKLADIWPMTARVHAQGRDGARWLLDFPVGHLNARETPAPGFQVETGPVLVPEALVEPGNAMILGGFALAYVFFNRMDRIDLAMFGPCGQGRAFGHFGRLDDVTIALHRAGAIQVC